MYPLDALLRLMTHLNIGASLALAAWLAMSGPPTEPTCNDRVCAVPPPIASLPGSPR